MSLARFSSLLLLCLAAVLTLPFSARAQVTLGDPPTAPKDVSGLPGGGPHRSDVTAGFSVNGDSREQMRSFYNAVYTASTGIPIDSTSQVASCFPGTNSTTFSDAVVRRINCFRAAAGIPASITLNSGEGSNDQAAAEMMSANTNLNHFPPTTWECYSSSGAHAASNSNIALGNDGSDAITAYIWDYGGNNSEVGHRRWILYPQTQIMGTGDIPAQGNFFSANATFVFDANLNGPRPATTHPYVSWPPEGFIPYQLAFPQWSFALSNADLSTATVTMRSNGVPVVISNQVYSLGYGENTVVWVPTNLDYTTTTPFPFSGADTVYSIVVTNIKIGPVTTGFAYNVTLFDPTVPGADYIPTVVNGPAQPAVGLPNNYTCVPPNNTNVTGYQWLVAQSVSGNLFDGAENGASNFTVDISPGYSEVTNGTVASGSDAYYLTMTSPVDQILQLNRVLLPATNALLKFASLLGYATSNQIAEVQISTTGGANWVNLYSQAGTGGAGDSSFTTHSLSLSNYAGQSVLLQFNYHYSPGGLDEYYNQADTSPPVGWFIDNILIANAPQLVNFSTNSTSSTNFTFTPAQTGAYVLQAEPILFNQFPVGFGPVTQVNAVTTVITLAQPVVAAGQVHLNFTVANGPPATFHLLQADQVTASWITNTTAVLTTNVPGSSYAFSTPVGPSARFYRVQTP